ncbi:unnamed protein product [Kuraishia capsulata CBS 1993]|uniref:Uncharacterized protein n=1 Tax=Kuraishia capsulata CBS 1993 TaxID=1382522 RepID=W6MLF4_9ASCO|nr:uncharacterized protein KUCA_T00003289001 [Kuraishia capsulata CBS 1993]CDK27311.1 unnamed protein product [Kuraishia capsulata CBS 1993]
MPGPDGWGYPAQTVSSSLEYFVANQNQVFTAYTGYCYHHRQRIILQNGWSSQSLDPRRKRYNIHIPSFGNTNLESFQWVKPPSGGWNHTPKNWKRNTAFVLAGYALSIVALYRIGEAGTFNPKEKYGADTVKRWNEAATKGNAARKAAEEK